MTIHNRVITVAIEADDSTCYRCQMLRYDHYSNEWKCGAFGAFVPPIHGCDTAEAFPRHPVCIGAELAVTK